MSSEPFVMSSVDRAQEWVNAFSTSCEIPADEAAAILAALCGFGSWDVMVFGIQSLRPSTCDESASKEQIESRILHYADVLRSKSEFCPAVVRAIVGRLSPSSCKPFKGIDLDNIDHTDCDEVHESEPFDIDEVFGVEVSPGRMKAMAPHFGRVDHDCDWVGALSAMGWAVEYCNSEELLGEPSCEIYRFEPDTPMVPVYFSHAIPAPEFTGCVHESPTIRLLQFACLGNFLTQFAPYGATDFLILRNRPKVTKLNGKWFCHIGVAYNSADGKWTDLLFNSACRDIDTLLSLNRSITSLQAGESTLAENDLEFTRRLVLGLAGFDPEQDSAEEWAMVGMPTGEAWSTLGAVPTDAYPWDELSPHVFDESSSPGEDPAA